MDSRTVNHFKVVAQKNVEPIGHYIAEVPFGEDCRECLMVREQSEATAEHIAVEFA